MKTTVITLNQERNVTLTCYIQHIVSENTTVTKRPAIIVLPGGGYQYCSQRESDPAAFPYLAAGYQAFVLNYTVGKNTIWSQPLDDYEQAVELIKSKAEEWEIDTSRIAVIGFSAGGHLAAAAATMARNRPAACILGYPVITEETARVYCSTAPGIPENVDEKTCPCFVFSSRTDGTVPINDTVRLIDALTKHGIPYECHIYAFANHGFTTCESSVQNRSWICTRTPDWVRDSIEWLKDTIGDFNNGILGKRQNW